MKKNETVKSKNIVTITTIAILIVLIGVTYAALEYQREGEKENVITTGVMTLSLDSAAGKGINIDPATPMTVSQGLEQTPEYKFVLNNTGSVDSNYRIKLVDDEEAYKEHECSNNRLDHGFLRIAVGKNDGEKETKILGGENDDIIDTGTITAGGENTYTLQIWIDDSADTSIGGTHFHGKIKLEAVVEGRTNYETGE